MSRRSPQAEPGGAFQRRSLPDPELLRGRQERQNQNSQDALRAVWNRGKHSTDASNANQRKASTLRPQLHTTSTKVIVTKFLIRRASVVRFHKEILKEHLNPKCLVT